MKIVLEPWAIMPTRAHEFDAGLDLYAPHDATIRSKQSCRFSTGVHIQLPQNTVGFLKCKSGLNVNHSLTSEGVIDCGYTGSIVVKLYNHSDRSYRVRKGDKISQLVILPCLLPELEVVDSLEDNGRYDKTGIFRVAGRNAGNNDRNTPNITLRCCNVGRRNYPYFVL